MMVAFSCRKGEDDVQPLDKWVNLHAPYIGSPSDIEFISSKVGCVVGRGFGGGDSLMYNIILTTKDGGTTWHSIYLSNNFLIDTIGSMLGGSNFYQYNPDILFAGGLMNNIWCSHDDGEHWKKANVTSPPGSPNSYFFDPANGISVSFGIYKTTDSGKTWKSVYKTDDFAFTFKILQFTSLKTGYAAGGVAFDATNFGLMVKTTDGGDTWQQINYPFHDILSMYFINDELGYVSVNLNSSGFAGAPPFTTGCELYKTTDGGNTWANVTPPLVMENKYDISNLYFKNRSEGFCTIAGLIYHTTDGGKTWQKEYDKITSVLIFPDNHTGYAIDATGSVLKREF